MQKLLWDFTCLQKPSLAPATLLVPREQPRYGLVTSIGTMDMLVWRLSTVSHNLCGFFCLCVEADGISKAWPRKHCVSCIPVPGLNSEHLIQNIVRKKRIVTLISKANKMNYLIVGQSYLDDFSADLTRVNLGQASSCCKSFNNLEHLVMKFF